MFDRYQREIHYLRLSVTDLCNLRCRYCMPDGVEKLEREAVLTSVTEKSFSVSTIPHTNAVTTLGERKEGDKVNLENDIIGKYVERLLGGGMTECKCPEQPDSRQKQTESKITKEFLTQYGF